MCESESTTLLDQFAASAPLGHWERTGRTLEPERRGSIEAGAEQTPGADQVGKDTAITTRIREGTIQCGTVPKKVNGHSEEDTH
jgi:hypothetical protein